MIYVQVTMMILILLVWVVNVYQAVTNVPGDLKWLNIIILPTVLALHLIQIFMPH